MNRADFQPILNVDILESLNLGEMMYWEKYRKIPNKIKIRVDTHEVRLSFWKLFQDLYKLEDRNLFYKVEDIWKSSDKRRPHFEVFEVKSCLWICLDYPELHLLYDFSVAQEEVEKVERLILEKINTPPTDQLSFAMLTSVEYGVEYKDYPLRMVDINLDDNYNDDFVSSHKRILDFLLDDQSSGLVLLHGKPGTGKTYYLRYLAHLVKKKFIFVPNHLFQQLTSPQFLPSLSEVPGNILLLEDCEDLIISRDHVENSASGIGSLLNLSDGFIADAFRFKIICTFNCDLSQIDKALLRKGRLVERYEFKELTKEKVNKLLGKEANTSMTLADVLNYGDDNNGEVTKSRVGF